MTHVRRQIRENVSSALSTSVTLVQRRVYPTRVFAIDGAKLPCLAVYTTSESSGLRTMGAKTISRSVSVVAEAYIRVSKSFDNDADAIAAQIEAAIAADTTLGGLAKDAILTSTDIEFSGEAETPIGVARLTYSVDYVTSIGDAETAR